MNGAGATARAAQAVVNRCLGLDPELEREVAELAGAVLEIHVRGLEARFRVTPGRDGVRIEAHRGGPHADPSLPAADVTVSGAPFSLARFFTGLDAEQAAVPADVAVSGDPRLMQRLRGLARRAWIDWEEPLSGLLGDAAAHEAGRGVRGLARWGRAAAHTLLEDIGEYLREERRATPARTEVGIFVGRVDDLRDDVERLEKRIARLERRIGERDS